MESGIASIVSKISNNNPVVNPFDSSRFNHSGIDLLYLNTLYNIKGTVNIILVFYTRNYS